MDELLTDLVLPLRGGCWTRLVAFIESPDGKHQSGGYQNRKRKWHEQVDYVDRWIRLDADDVGWIQRQIMNRDGGGWQKKISDIFIGQHASFSRLPKLPRSAD